MSAQTLSEHIVQSVATHTDTDPLELPPLYHAIDPDALNKLVTESTDALDEVQFSYAGYSITVQSDWSVNISDLETGMEQRSLVADS